MTKIKNCQVFRVPPAQIPLSLVFSEDDHSHVGSFWGFCSSKVTDVLSYFTWMLGENSPDWLVKSSPLRDSFTRKFTTFLDSRPVVGWGRVLIPYRCHGRRYFSNITAGGAKIQIHSWNSGYVETMTTVVITSQLLSNIWRNSMKKTPFLCHRK